MTKSSDSPASPLANCVSNKDDKPKLVILSGPSGVGKSTWCQGFADRARAAGAIVGGFISPPVFINGQKVGIDIVDQLSGERRCLAVRRTDGDDDTDSPNWHLDLGTLSWANQRLVDMSSCDCLILDELGPMEFLRGKGLLAGLELVDSRRASLTVTVIRPKLLSLAEELWPWGDVGVIVDDELVDRDSGEEMASLEDV